MIKALVKIVSGTLYQETEHIKQGNYYLERNQLVAALSKISPAYLAKHPKEDKKWEDDWRTIVYIEIPIEKTKFHDEQSEKIFPRPL